MNPGDEKRFDGLLKNKFHEFEAAPNAAVWQAVSQTLPPAKPGLMQRAIPFGLGTAFGIMVSLGFVSGYQHFAADGTGSGSVSEAAVTPANQAETTLAPALANTPAQPGTSVSGNGTNQAESATYGSQNQVGGTGNALALANSETGNTRVSDAQPRTTYSNRRVVTTEYEHNRIVTSETASYTAAARRRANRSQQVAAPVVSQVAAVNTASAAPASSVTQTRQAETVAPVNTIAQKPAQVMPSAWLTGHELDTAIAKVLTVDPKLTTNKAELKELLKAQGTVLAVLQNRNDSLLLALKDAELDSTIAKVRINRPRRHSAIKPPVGWASPSAWAVTAGYEANPQWGGHLINPDQAKATENVRTSRTFNVGIKHRVNQRLSFTGGLGLTKVEADLNYKRKEQFSGTDTITGATVITYIDQHQFLRPEYHFVNMPLGMSYRMSGYGHFGISLNAGLQPSLYRGGTMAVLTDGEYTLKKAGASEGPFKSFSLAATGGIDLSYRVTPRVTLQGGPTLRYWALSPYKQADAGYKFLPGLQFGMSLDL